MPPDRLSNLPDDILIHGIIPLLPMVEAQRTCILSRRWRLLWLCDLDFDGSTKFVSKPASDYIQWVGQVINTYRASSTLQRFRIRFPLAGGFTREIDSWLQFCLGKQGTEALDLDCCIYPTGMDYSKLNPHCCYMYRLPCELVFPKLKLLKSLALSGVDITCDSLEHIFLECDFLETLQLRNLGSSLTGFDVPGPASTAPSRLKHIDIFCTFVKWLTISVPTPDLVSLTHRYSDLRLVQVEHAPKLVDLSISLLKYYDVDMPLLHPYHGSLPSHPLLRYLSQLHSLHVDMWCWYKVWLWLAFLPDLSNLKHLTLTLHGFRVYRPGDSDSKSINGITSLIKRARYLKRLTLLVNDVEGELKIWTGFHVNNIQLPLLREIEIVGFTGRKVECDLTMIYALAVASSLEKLIIDGRQPQLKGHLYGEYDGAVIPDEWRRGVAHLRSRLPSRVKMFVIGPL